MEVLKIYLNREQKQKNLEIINQLSLKERKQQVINELNNKNINLDKLNFLILMDNTNEDLLYRYIESMGKDLFYTIMQQYSSYISLSKIKDLLIKIYGNANKGYRNFSYKNLFFDLLSAVKNSNKKIIDEKLLILKKIDEKNNINNQPFDLGNFEAFYFYLCDLLSNQIKKQNKGKLDEYFDYLKDYILSISNILKEYECEKKEEYKEEKKDIKKFFTIFFSIINLDAENYTKISQVALVFKQLSDENRKKLISAKEEYFKILISNKASEEFKKIVANKKIYSSINNTENIIYLKNKIEIPEECYSYEYIIENNIFKKYEGEIKYLMKEIYKSDLFKHLIKIIYKTENNNMKYFFEENNFVEDFWNNNIIFVPFRIEKVSGFSYKDSFLFFFPIYKIKHFKSEIEDEIFTLGAFVRVLIHETFGHLIISYIFFMFYANVNDYDNYLTPRINDQIKQLNKQKLCEFIGSFLAKILFDNLYNQKKKESNDVLKKKLCEEFKPIIGRDYAEKLTQRLLENSDIQISNIDNETTILEGLSGKIVDILIDLISEEFNKYINDLKDKQEKYREKESGNFVEFLLFNDFSQYMTLKECLFLLNEEIYKNTNFIKFRSDFKNLIFKNNDEFLKELNEGQKIFAGLFAKYNSIYEEKKNINNDLVSPQSFRGSCDDNLNKKFEAFECFNFKRSRFESGKISEN